MIKGKCCVFPEYVMAYDIIIPEYWTTPIDAEDNSRWIMAGVREEFNKENAFKDAGYTFIVADHNFAGLSFANPNLRYNNNKYGFIDPSS